MVCSVSLFLTVGLQLLVDSDVQAASAVWRCGVVEELIDRAWAGDRFIPPVRHTNRWHRYIQFFTAVANQPR